MLVHCIYDLNKLLLQLPLLLLLLLNTTTTTTTTTATLTTTTTTATTSPSSCLTRTKELGFVILHLHFSIIDFYSFNPRLLLATMYLWCVMDYMFLEEVYLYEPV